MSTKIVCVEKSAPNAWGHSHIVALGVGSDPRKASSRQTVQKVRANLASGERYYTVSPSTGSVAYVTRFDCSCGIHTIRSHADAVTDNNLDNLRVCNFS